MSFDKPRSENATERFRNVIQLAPNRLLDCSNRDPLHWRNRRYILLNGPLKTVRPQTDHVVELEGGASVQKWPGSQIRVPWLAVLPDINQRDVLEVDPLSTRKKLFPVPVNQLHGPIETGQKVVHLAQMWGGHD